MFNDFRMLCDIESILGKPYCSGDDFLIYNADCIEAMRKLPAELCALTATSPPYNIGKEYETPLPLDEYLNWCEAWIREVHRITRIDGAFLLNVGYVEIPNVAKAVPLPYLLWNRTPFYLIQEIVWNYGAGVAARKSLSPRNEKLLWFVKDQLDYVFNLDSIRDPNVKYPNQKKNGKLRCNTLGKNPSDVWQIAKVTSGTNRSSPERTPHPAQFPTDFVDRIVLGFSNPGDLVIDPFMGSGSTAISCLEHGRRVIGFELKREYCDVAAHRIESYLADKRSRLFA